MSHRGRWIAATDAEASTLWTKSRSNARNPFTRKMVEVDVVETLDEAALFAWPHAVEADGYGNVPDLFGHRGGPLAATLGEPSVYSRDVFRMAEDQVAAVAAMTNAETWRERMRIAYPKAPAGFEARITDAHAEPLIALARKAALRGGTVWGFFLVG